jgi:CHAT domain-containing protein
MSLRFALGALCARASRWTDAKESLFQAFRIESTALSDEAGLRSGRQIRTMFSESRARIGTLLDVLAQDPQRSAEDVRQAYEVIQQRRGLETRLIRLQKPSFITDRALTSVPQERLEAIKAQVGDIVEQLGRAREDWLAALIREAEHAGPDPDGMSVVAYQDRVERFERQLAGYVGQGSRDFELLGVGSSVPTVAEDRAVVEYVYADTPTPAYYAFVVRRDGLQFVPLGEAQQIQQALLQLRAAIVDGDADPGDPDPPWRRRSRFLANRLLKPLLPSLDATAQLYIVPDAELFTLPFDLLPLEDGRLAIDRWTVSHLWNGGELSRFDVILGNPPSPKQAVVLSALACADGVGDDAWHFAALPFADKEGAALTKKLGAVDLPGAKATKAAVESSADAEILHFATHSFNVSLAEPGAPSSDETPLLYRARSLLADPMLRSGIALSGADLELTTPTAASPGILFAAEVLNLDLRNTDLAVLSSCQSGLGDPRPGDGIHGLRRAFRAAGCSSVVSSLWKVPDEATCEFMVDFYDRLLAQTPRGQALRDAKLAMRKRHADDPLFWAAFVLDGSDRPLFRFSGMQGLKIVNMSGVGFSYDLALDHIAHQRWNEAEEQLASVLNSRTATDELRAKAASTLAKLLRQRGRLQESISLWDQLVTSSRTPADVWASAVEGRAITKQMSGDFVGANLDYASALRSAGTAPAKRAWLLVNRGALFSQHDNFDLAIADFSEVIANAESPADQRWKALLNRADAYRQLKRYEDAMADATALVDAPGAKGSDERAQAYIALALCYSEQGDLPGAIAAVRQHLQQRAAPAPPDASKRLDACKSAEQLTELIATLI